MQEVIKPWGKYVDYIREDNIVLKGITVNPHSKLSYQSHNYREEHWYVVSGRGLAIIEGVEIPLKKGKYIYIDPEQKHRIINTGSRLLRIVEIQLGMCDESDITRYEDDYGR